MLSLVNTGAVIFIVVIDLYFLGLPVSWGDFLLLLL